MVVEKAAICTVGRLVVVVVMALRAGDGLRTRPFIVSVVGGGDGVSPGLRLRVRRVGARRGGVGGAGGFWVGGGEDGIWMSKTCIWRVGRVAGVDSQI